MPQPTVFVSYSHRDEAEKDTLLQHLGVLKFSGQIDLWSDDRISAGSTWEKDINRAIAQAKVAILLISANFLTSEFILGTEVPALLKRRRQEGLIVFPVLAKSCAWKSVGWLNQMQVRPKNGRPVWREGGIYADEELALIAEEVADILKEAQLDEFWSVEEQNLTQPPGLKELWEPFVSEGAKIFVPYEAPEDGPQTRMKVNALTMRSVFSVYRSLVGLFAGTFEFSRIKLDIDGVVRSDANLDRLRAAADHPHLIVIGAPGSNPLSNYLMAQFKGLSLADRESIVRRGYIFRVAGSYLDNPFIVSDLRLQDYTSQEQAAMLEPGIYDLMPGHTPHPFKRSFPRFDVPRLNDQDCAIIVTGRAALPNDKRRRRVVIIAGHSRHSTLFGTTFAATSEEWAQRVNAFGAANTETVIGLQPDPSGAPVKPTILAGPREIYRQ